MAYKRIKGIYTITNKVTNRVYIGKSINIKVRWCRHRYDLRDGIHWSEKMQKDYDEFGIESFKFSIIEEAPNAKDTNSLNELEIHYIKEFSKIMGLYNKSKGGQGNKGVKFSEETRRRMSESRKGQKRTQEMKDRISKGMKKKLLINGVKYEGMGDTAIILGICTDTLLKRLRSDEYPEYQYDTSDDKSRTTMPRGSRA